MEKTVADIMTRDVTTVTMDDTLGWVRDIFDTKTFQHAVVTEAGRVVGVISDRDLLKHISPFIGKMHERSVDTKSLSRKVHQVMSRDLIWVRPETSIRRAARFLVDNNVSCLPVLCPDARTADAEEPRGEVHGRCIGIITDTDILRFAIDLIACDVDEDADDAFEQQLRNDAA